MEKVTITHVVKTMCHPCCVDFLIFYLTKGKRKVKKKLLKSMTNVSIVQNIPNVRGAGFGSRTYSSFSWLSLQAFVTAALFVFLLLANTGKL